MLLVGLLPATPAWTVVLVPEKKIQDVIEAQTSQLEVQVSSCDRLMNTRRVELSPLRAGGHLFVGSCREAGGRRTGTPRL